MAQNKYSKSDLADEMESVAHQLNHPPTVTEFNEIASIGVNVYYRRIADSWDEILEQFGFDSEEKGEKIVKNEKKLLDDIRSVVEQIGRQPTLTEYQKHGKYPVDRYYDVFGSWSNAKQQIGFDSRPSPNKTTKQDVIFDIKNIASELGRPPSNPEYTQNGEYSNTVIYRFFDSWQTAIEAAGFENKNFRKLKQEIDKEELIEALQSDVDMFGEVPSKEKQSEKGTYSATTYQNHFESWNRALQIAGFELNKKNNTQKEVNCAACGGTFQAPKWKRKERDNLFCSRKCQFDTNAFTVTCRYCGEETTTNYTQYRNDRYSFCDDDCLNQYYSGTHYGPSWPSQKQKARKRDGYECQCCGMTQEKHCDKFKMSLHVHHIRPWHEFENHQNRNELANLITLCAECHPKWEKLPVRPQIVQ